MGREKVKKIIFLDIDDTLLKRDKTIPEENREAIDRAVRAGHKVVITTGRPLAATLTVVEQLGLMKEGCYAIACNGGTVYDCGARKLVLRDMLSASLAREIASMAKEAGIHVQAYANDERNTVLTENENEEVHFYCDRIHMSFSADPSFPETITDDTVKLLFIDLHDHEKLENFRKKLAEWGKGKIEVFFSNGLFLECVPAGVNKGNAIRRFADFMGVPLKDTVSAGDSENDLPMLEAAGIGCAMRNASEACLKIADYITARDCDHAGVAEVIERFLLAEV